MRQNVHYAAFSPLMPVQMGAPGRSRIEMGAPGRSRIEMGRLKVARIERGAFTWPENKARS